jgi:hypothetical protein
MRIVSSNKQTNKQSPWPESAWELYLPIDRRLSTNLVLTFADRVPRGRDDGSLQPYSRLSRLVVSSSMIQKPSCRTLVERVTFLCGCSERLWKLKLENVLIYFLCLSNYMYQNFLSKSLDQLLQIMFWNVYGRNYLFEDKINGCLSLHGGSSFSNTALCMKIMPRPKGPMSRCALHTPDLASCEILLPRLKVVFYSDKQIFFVHIKINWENLNDFWEITFVSVSRHFRVTWMLVWAHKSVLKLMVFTEL